MPSIPFDAAIQKITELTATWGLRLLGGILLLIGGWIVARWTARGVARACERSGRVDSTVQGYLSKLAHLAVLVITIIAVLNNFGVQTASLIAVLGAMGLAVGLALQGTLSNVASGLVLLVLRPFKAGDAVEVGAAAGVVQEIGLFATELKTADGLYLLIPNAKVWGGQIKNITRNGKRRIDLVIGISYSADMSRAVEVIEQVLAEEPRILPEPAPVVTVAELADSSVNLFVRPWTTVDDHWPTRWALTRRIKEALDGVGIEIPFPQREVHVHKAAGS